MKKCFIAGFMALISLALGIGSAEAAELNRNHNA